MLKILTLLLLLALPANGQIVYNPNLASSGLADSGAWVSYTPVLTCNTGTLTTATPVGKTKTILGKTVLVNIVATLTTVGTCATQLNATLPITSNQTGVLIGREVALTGAGMQGSIVPAGTTVGITKYDGTFAPANGWTVVIEGAYESQ